MADRKNQSTRRVPKPRTDADLQPPEGAVGVHINEHAVADAACFGPQARAEALYRETYRTVRRLRARLKGHAAFSSPPRGKGGWPGVDDVIRWLDSLTRACDLSFLKRLHLTLSARVSRVVQRAIKKEFTAIEEHEAAVAVNANRVKAETEKLKAKDSKHVRWLKRQERRKRKAE